MTVWNDPEQCYTDKWGNEVYPERKAIETTRTITSIENDIDHALVSLECALNQVQRDMPLSDEWAEWRTTNGMIIANALDVLYALRKANLDLTDKVMWKMVQRDDWFKVRESENDASY